MAKTDFQSVDQYIATQPAAARPVLERIRATIRKALPGADEVISYQIPAYKLPGGTVIYFAGWSQHYSLYPATKGVVAAFKVDLAPYEVNDKGTIRFPLSKPVPVRLIARIAKLRAQETADAVVAKAAKRRPAARPASKPAPKRPTAKPASKRPTAKPAPKRPTAKPASKRP